MDQNRLISTPMPPLVTILLIKEREKGSPLSEAEVIEIRDAAVCIMLPAEQAAKIAEMRGYADIDPENVWEQWITLRPSLRL